MSSKNSLINLVKHAWYYSFDQKGWFVFVVVFSVIGNAVWLLYPIVIGKVFDRIQFAEQGDQVRYVAYGVLILIALNLVSWVFHGFSRIVENRNAFLIRKNYRQTMFERVMALPTSWHKDHHSGDTIDKINKASERLFDFSSELFMLIQNSTGLVASLIILSFYDVQPIILAVFSSVVAVVVIIKFDKKLLENYKIINKAENFISSGIYDYISNYITVISLRLKDRASQEMESRSMSPFRVFVKNSKMNEMKWFISSMIVSLMTAGVLFMNAYNSFRTQGVIVIGTLFVLYQYLDRIGNSFYVFAWKYSDTVRQNAAVVAADDINMEFDKLHLSEKHLLPNNWNKLTISGLNFSYKDEGANLKNINLEIQPRKKIALIGVSGSGKSTILSLLRGLHVADSVDIECDDIKLPGSLEYFCENATLIPQEPEIFNNTIEFNITLGVHVKKKQLEKVIELTNLIDLISRLSKGLKTNVLEKGVSLSGGEKQRLALARGLLAAQDSQFLLLDEPTSSVDVGNEYEIYQNIFNAFSEKVIISAVHSLHLLPHFDYVYMFKRGRLIAEGNFKEMKNNEEFNVLWKKYNTEVHKAEEINI